MLRVNLGQLARESSVVVEGSLPGDDELWKDMGFSWVGDVDVRLRATYAGTGEVVVRGDASGVVRQECRRCLDPVETPFARDLTMVFV
ncbi:MAG: YceD family protein, partial [Longimicrobiales bacterium]